MIPDAVAIDVYDCLQLIFPSLTPAYEQLRLNRTLWAAEAKVKSDPAGMRTRVRVGAQAGAARTGCGGARTQDRRSKSKASTTSLTARCAICRPTDAAGTLEAAVHVRACVVYCCDALYKERYKFCASKGSGRPFAETGRRPGHCPCR